MYNSFIICLGLKYLRPGTPFTCRFQDLSVDSVFVFRKSR